MDFLDFENHDLYFDEVLTPAQTAILKQAADAYPDKKTEKLLRGLYADRPESMHVLVAMYRFYYYQHRYEDALDIAAHALGASAKTLGLTVDWSELGAHHLSMSASMGLIRFYMLALKAAAYLLLRLGRVDEAIARLDKIIELDPADQFGATFLHKIAKKEQVNRDVAKQANVESLFRTLH
jgi:tetratricopeptide (TPR) repeat protein